MANDKIFFSYSRSDSEFAQQLAKELRSAGVDVWIDQLDIPAGSRWDIEVEKALHDAGRMLVILSPESVESTNVGDEVAFALEEKMQLVPILHKDCRIPFRIRRLQHIDFTEDHDKGFEKLLRALQVQRAQPLDPDKNITQAGQKTAEELKAEEEQKRKLAAEAERKAAEERTAKELAEKKKAEEEQKRKLVAEAERKAAEERKAIELAEKKKAEEEQNRKLAAVAEHKAAEERKAKELAEKKRIEEEQKRKLAVEAERKAAKERKAKELEEKKKTGQVAEDATDIGLLANLRNDPKKLSIAIGIPVALVAIVLFIALGGAILKFGYVVSVRLDGVDFCGI